jgi:hypothetical protein
MLLGERATDKLIEKKKKKEKEGQERKSEKNLEKGTKIEWKESKKKI